MSTFEKFDAFCKEYCFDNVTANYTVCTETHFVDCLLYPKRILDLGYLVPVTVFLLVLFFTGFLGNLSVCMVILKHPSMRSETNIYLFSLAVSDILLLVFGLLPELWYYWHMYPYVFGEVTCQLTNFFAATATWASALTVVALSVERYTAICHHSRFRTRDRKRVAIALLAIWSISAATALPAFHVYHIVINEKATYPGTGEISLLSKVCKVREVEEYEYHDYIYVVTCVLFFFIPMAVLLLMYIKIALFLSKHMKQTRNNGITNNCLEDNKIFKVLVGVVLAFFVCGAPFHYQRLATVYAIYYKKHTDSQTENSEPMDQDDKAYLRMLFVATALFYYLSATINPLLYNVMSKRYRKAFKEIISRKTRQDDFPMSTVAEARTTNRYNSKNKTITGSYSSVAQ